MNNIPTAEEFLNIGLEESGFEFHGEMKKIASKKLIQFAKLHVEPALKAAAEKATAEIELGNPYDPESGYPIVNQQSILNAYPLNLIK
jgi:hypothetical protein